MISKHPAGLEDKMNIKSLPEEERPIEKIIYKGSSYLSNAELLALIIHTGSKNRSAIDIAEEILATTDDGISGLCCAMPEELMAVSGVGESKAATILAAIELGKRIRTNSAAQKYIIRGAEDVANLIQEELRYEKKEHFKSILMNTKGVVIEIDEVSVGELTNTVVHPREVFKKAIKRSAASIIFVHNHPSGDPTPSKEDILTTKRLVEVGKLLGIRVLDHVVIGDGEYVSMMSSGLMNT